jgi:hypothetical protein
MASKEVKRYAPPSISVSTSSHNQSSRPSIQQKPADASNAGKREVEAFFLGSKMGQL